MSSLLQLGRRPPPQAGRVSPPQAGRVSPPRAGRASPPRAGWDSPAQAGWDMVPRWLANALPVLAIGCAAKLAVPVHPQPAFATAQLVDSPPPPAQIEYLSAKPPRPDCRWVDGQWIWNSRRWDWRPGGWVQPPKDCEYSLPSATWVGAQGSGALYYRPGRWYSVSEPKTCPDPAPCPSPDVRSRELPRSP